MRFSSCNPILRHTTDLILYADDCIMTASAHRNFSTLFFTIVVMAAVESNGNSAETLVNEKLVNVPRSTNPVGKDGISECFRVARTSMYLSLAPCHITNPIDGIKQQHLDPLVMKYFPKGRGVVLGYSGIVINESEPSDSDTQIKEVLAPVSDLSPFAFMWVTVDLLLWVPQVGDTLKGYIYMQTASHLGLLVHDTFNAFIRFSYIPQKWTFVPNQADDFDISEKQEDDSNGRSNFRSYGHWKDSTGLKVEGKITFTVRAILTTGKMISLEGTLVSPESELDAQPVHKTLNREQPQALEPTPAVNSHVNFDTTDKLQDDPATATKSKVDGIPGYVASSDSSDSDSD